jgi:hypothetical protein
MKKIKTLAVVAIIFFASSTIQAQVSVGVNIGLPTVVISGHYERGYEPQRRTVEYPQERVVYENHRHYDNRYCDDRRCQAKRYEDCKHHGKGHGGKKYKKHDYKGKNHHERDYDDRDDD